MNTEEIRNFCLELEGSEESFPFDETCLVFKIRHKIFALLSLGDDKRLTLKCDPQISIDLREQYSFVESGYHMNKKHWISVLFPEVSGPLLKNWIENSYELVLKGAGN